MVASIISIAFSLFLVMDPIGNVPIYLTVLHEIHHRRRLWIIGREMVIALIIILIFAFLGNQFLHALSISHEAIFFAGGIVLFVMALKMIFPEKGSLLDSLGIEGEPIVFPLAVPLVAGPSVLAAVMIYSYQLETIYPLILAILFSWICSTIILMASTLLQKWLGFRGIKALERLMGLILMLIAINMVLKGVDLFHLIRKV